MQSKPLLQTTEQNLIRLPDRPIRIGIFISGGLDSALLYHFLKLANVDNKHTIVPITVIKNNQTLNFVRSVLNFYGYSNDPVVLEGPINRAVVESYNLRFDRVYLGTIKELPEFLQGWNSTTYPETKFFRTPFKDFDKSQIVKIIVEEKLNRLFEITHSCAVNELGRCETCNRCKERKWAFDRLEFTDPGML